MPTTRFVELGPPRPALVDVRAPQPRRYYAALVGDLLRCSAPASRRPRGLRAAAARHDLVERPLSAAVALRRSRPHPRLARIREDLVESWEALAQRSDRLPSRAPALSLLVLRRSLGWLVFAFGDDDHPLLVCKVPEGEDPRVDEEADLLETLAGLGAAPRYLGRAGTARVQEGLPGRPLRLDPLSRSSAASAAWAGPLPDAAELLHRLAAGTVGEAVPPTRLSGEALALLDARIAARAEASIRRVAELDVSVLCHGDASPQNLLVDDGVPTGLVDWEFARRGLPGADVLSLVHTVFEQRLGLLRWREPDVLRAFGAAWRSAPLFLEGRRAARAVAESVGVPGGLAEDLEVAFYARRLQRRVDRPAHYLGGPRLAAHMLELVCAP